MRTVRLRKIRASRGSRDVSTNSGSPIAFSMRSARARITGRVVPARFKVVREAHLHLATLVAQGGVEGKYSVRLEHHETPKAGEE